MKRLSIGKKSGSHRQAELCFMEQLLPIRVFHFC